MRALVVGLALVCVGVLDVVPGIERAADDQASDVVDERRRLSGLVS